MKSLLLQIAGVLPLLLLAVWSCVELARGGAADARAVDAADTDSVKEAWERARGECAAAEDVDLAKRIAEADSLAADRTELGSTSDGNLKELVEALRSAEAAREFAKRSFEAIARAKEDADSQSTPLEKANAELEDLDKFAAKDHSLEVEKVAGADGVLRAIEQVRKRLGARRDELTAEEDVRKILREAAACLNAHATSVNRERYLSIVACFEKLDKLKREPSNFEHGAAIGDQIKLLWSRALYKMHWYAAFKAQYIAEKGRSVDISTQAEYDRARIFFEKLEHGSCPTDAERAFQSEAERTFKNLKIEIRIAYLAKSRSAKQLLTRADATLKLKPDDDQIRRIREAVDQWIRNNKQGLPVIDEVPQDLQKKYKEAIWTPKATVAPAGRAGQPRQAAETKPSPPRRLIGEFSDSINAKLVRYRAQSADMQRFQDVSLEDLGPLDKPVYAKLGERYDEERKRVIKRDATREDWETAAQKLDELRQDLADYRAKWGSIDRRDDACRWDDACRELSFEPALATAREVLDQWDLYEQIMRR